MKLSYSKHARDKIRQREISEGMVAKALEKPEARLYDTSSRAEVVVSKISQQDISLDLLVIFRRRNDVFHIITAYPVKDVRDEMERKIKMGRWIPLKQ